MISHSYALVLSCIHGLLATVTLHSSYGESSSLAKRAPQYDGVNGTVARVSNVIVLSAPNVTNASSSDNGGTTISSLIQNSTSVIGNTVAGNVSLTDHRRLLIETSESTNHGYLTSNCDARTLGATDATEFDDLLAGVQANLRIVVNQAKRGAASKYGFQALFKSSSNTRKVATLFGKIMHVADAENNPTQGPIKPLVVCVGPQAHEEGVVGMEKLYAACQSHPGRRALQPFESNIVLLCPSFWELPGVPPGEFCPRKNAQGVMTPNEAWLQLNRQSIFVHEMAHMYLKHVSGKTNETYNVADAVALSEDDSLRNPSNYAFFYAGKQEFR